MIRHRFGFCAILSLLLATQVTRGDRLDQPVISEIVPRGGIWQGRHLPAHIELTLAGAVNQPFDLVVLQAAPGRTESIEQVFTITPEPGDDLVVLHEGDLPGALPGGVPSNVQPLAVADLPLGRPDAPTSRRLVALNGKMPEAFGADPPAIDTWHTRDDLPEVVDIVTWVEPTWIADPLPGETVWQPQVGGALVRTVDAAGDFTEAFEILPPDGLGATAGEPGLSPARTNPNVSVPAPGGATVLVMLVTGLALRRPRATLGGPLKRAAPVRLSSPA